jgi:hypothetical protein
MALGQHIVFRLADSRVIAPSPVERRLVARVVLELARHDELLSFGLADTHLHLLAACDRQQAGRLARRVESSLVQRLRLDVGFGPPYFEEVKDNRHLYHAFTYVLEQSTHHGLQWDPLHEACNLPDLLGLRVLGTYTVVAVRRRLPRIRREDLLACMGIEELQTVDGPPENEVPPRVLGRPRSWHGINLVTATVAATGLPTLEGRSPEIVNARRALVHVAGRGLAAPSLAALLGVSDRTVHELRRQPADPQRVSAIRLQLGLMQQRAEALLRCERPFTQAARDESPSCSRRAR